MHFPLHLLQTGVLPYYSLEPPLSRSLSTAPSQVNSPLSFLFLRSTWKSSWFLPWKYYLCLVLGPPLSMTLLFHWFTILNFLGGNILLIQTSKYWSFPGLRPQISLPTLIQFLIQLPSLAYFCKACRVPFSSQNLHCALHYLHRSVLGVWRQLKRTCPPDSIASSANTVIHPISQTKH